MVKWTFLARKYGFLAKGAAGHPGTNSAGKARCFILGKLSGKAQIPFSEGLLLFGDGYREMMRVIINLLRTFIPSVNGSTLRAPACGDTPLRPYSKHDISPVLAPTLRGRLSFAQIGFGAG